MPDIDLCIEGPDGQIQPIVKRGAKLPAQGRAVFATQRAGERGLSFKLHEGEVGALELVGTFSAELPPGLPANCWLSVFVKVDEQNRVRAVVKENLRRIEVDAVGNETGRSSTVFGS